MSKMKSMLDYIEMVMQEKRLLTKEEFTRIRNEGTESELEEAVAQMMAQGGYENLADD